MTCPHCNHAAKLHSYQDRRVVTAHGAVKVRRAYYYCGRSHQSFLPYDDALGLVEEIIPGLRPLVSLAGTLAPFADAAQVVLTRFSGVRLSASAVREEFRKLIGYFENNPHSTDYLSHRQKGWDIGSRSTEAGCKIIGERLRGSGMRWVEEGAATVAALRRYYTPAAPPFGTGSDPNPTATPAECHASKRRSPIPDDPPRINRGV